MILFYIFFTFYFWLRISISFVSSVSLIAHGSIFMMTALKSLLVNSNVCIILVLLYVHYLFSFKLIFSWSWNIEWFFFWLYHGYKILDFIKYLPLHWRERVYCLVTFKGVVIDFSVLVSVGTPVGEDASLQLSLMRVQAPH